MRHPRDMNPSGRALYWYLRCVTGLWPEIKTASTESGIPLSTIYEATRRYPDTFVIRSRTINTSDHLPEGAVGLVERYNDAEP